MSRNHIPVRISTVITNENRDQIQYLIDICEELGMYVTYTPPCIDSPPEERHEGTMQLMLSDDQTVEFFKELKEHKKTTSRIFNSERSIDYMINYPVSFSQVVMKDDPDADYYKTPPCPYGRIQHIFTNTGEVFPCGIWWNRDDFTSKNVLDDGLDAALKHAANIPCKFCSFCNLVDWNELASISSLARGGTMISIRQSLLNKFKGSL